MCRFWRQGLVLGIEQDGKLPVGFQNGVFHGGQVDYALLAQVFNQLVHGETGAPHFVLKHMPFPDEHGGIAADKVAEADAFQIEYGKNHGYGEQSQDRHHAIEQRNTKILHGHCRQIGDQQRQHQFRGFQLADLPLAHQAQAQHDQKIKNEGTDQRSQHMKWHLRLSVSAAAPVFMPDAPVLFLCL